MADIEKISETIKTVENVTNNDSIRQLVQEGNITELAEVVKKLVEKVDELVIEVNALKNQ